MSGISYHHEGIWVKGWAILLCGDDSTLTQFVLTVLEAKVGRWPWSPARYRIRHRSKDVARNVNPAYARREWRSTARNWSGWKRFQFRFFVLQLSCQRQGPDRRQEWAGVGPALTPLREGDDWSESPARPPAGRCVQRGEDRFENAGGRFIEARKLVSICRRQRC